MNMRTLISYDLKKKVRRKCNYFKSDINPLNKNAPNWHFIFRLNQQMPTCNGMMTMTMFIVVASQYTEQF